LEVICPEEIVNAMCYAARLRPLHRDELMRATLAQFNQKRLTPNVSFRLKFCIDLAIEDHRLEQSAAGYRAVT
jgi:hypothetical protein